MRENIWVGVRLRPVSGSNPDKCWTCTQPGLLQQHNAQGAGLYHYDRVLDCSTSTAGVLEAVGEERFLCALQVVNECARCLADGGIRLPAFRQALSGVSYLQGFHSTLFCYG